MRRIQICFLIALLLCATFGCQRGPDFTVELDDLAARYGTIRSQVWEEGEVLSLSPEIIESYRNNSPVPLPENSVFTSGQFYDIQGHALDGSGATLRDTVPYQRLMGHLDYYTYLEDIDGTAHQSIIIKMWDPDPDLVPLKFIGILKLSLSLDSVLEKDAATQDMLIMDSSKSIVILDDDTVTTDLEEDPVLNGFFKDISLLNEREGTDRISQSDLAGEYQYKITDGFVVLKKVN